MNEINDMDIFQTHVNSYASPFVHAFIYVWIHVYLHRYIVDKESNLIHRRPIWHILVWNISPLLFVFSYTNALYTSVSSIPTSNITLSIHLSGAAPVNISEYEKYAKDNLSRNAHGYYARYGI
jgi:hypothetical protein